MAYFSSIKVKKSIEPVVIGVLSQELATTTLSSAVTAGDTSISVTSGAGISNGDYISIVDPVSYYFDQLTVLSGGGTTTLNLDMPVGNDYSIGTTVTASNTNFGVDGSVTPVKFNFKTGIEAIPARALISRIIITIQTSTAISLGDFGDISGGILKGIYLRRTTSTVNETYFNAKTNFDLLKIAKDLDPIDNAGGATDFGLCVRLTFTKMGSFIPLAQNEDLELWVPDDLSGLVRAEAIIEGDIE